MSTETRMIIKINKNLKMTPGKAAAQAVHAALTLAKAHHGGPVIVLQGTKKQTEACEAVVHDAGRTEVEPGATTAGAYFEEKEFPADRPRVFTGSTVVVPSGMSLEDKDIYDFALEVKWVGVPDGNGQGGYAVQPYGRYHANLSRAGNWAYHVQKFQRKNYRWATHDEALQMAVAAVDSYEVNGRTWKQWKDHFAGLDKDKQTV